MKITLALAIAAAVQVGDAGAPDTVYFTPEVASTVYEVKDPVLRIKPGTVLVSSTMFGAYFNEEGGAFPGEVGPIYIEGATPQDVLVVKVHKIQPNHDLAASQLYPDFGGLTSDARTRMLNDPIEARRYVWRLDRENMTATAELPDSEMREITIDLQPMLGRLAVAPRGGEAFAGLWPGDFGGNMDTPEIREGSTVYLPVFHEGAYFYFGDGHARQGDGEVAGTGLETSMDVILEIDLIKGKAIDWPRIEDDEYIMVAGSGRPLIDAFRIAHVELIEWLEEDYGFGRWDALELMGQVGETNVGNVVDPNYTIVAKFPKRFLPD